MHTSCIKLAKGVHLSGPLLSEGVRQRAEQLTALIVDRDAA